MPISNVTVSEFIRARRGSELSGIFIAGMDNCAPCRLVEEALELLEGVIDLPILKSSARSGEKKDFGDLAKAGITRFPMIEIYMMGNRVHQENGVQGTTPSEVAKNMARRWVPHIKSNMLTEFLNSSGYIDATPIQKR